MTTPGVGSVLRSLREHSLWKHPLWKKLSTATFWIVAFFIGALLIGGTYLAVRLRDDEPVTYEDIREHFKYGSTGGERG